MRQKESRSGEFLRVVSGFRENYEISSSFDWNFELLGAQNRLSSL